jgi:single-stranded DNA-specific DHH superfamily exonuclease
LKTENFDVFMVQLKSDAKVVNLVASEARNRIQNGITVAHQARSQGRVIELRRTRNLHHPDLARLLLDMDPKLFVARGGHPMAAGATLSEGKDDEFFNELQRAFARM